MRIDKTKLNQYYQEFIETYSPCTEACDEFLLTTHITAVASAIGTKRHIIRGTKKLYSNIWSIIIGESTVTRKSTALSIGISPIRNYEEDNNMMFIISPSTSSNIFMESLSSNRNAIMVAPEIKILLESLNKQYNGDFKARLTDIFDVPETVSFHFRSINDGKPVVVQKPYLCISGASTPSWLNETIKNSDFDSGFLPRFIFCLSQGDVEPIPNPPKPDANSVQELQNKFKELYALEEAEVTISDEAKRLYARYYISQRKVLKRTYYRKLRPFWGRLVDDYCLKFALIEAVIAGKDTIGKKEMQRAIYLTGLYRLQIQEILDNIVADPTREKEKIIMTTIRKQEMVSTSELYRILHCSAKELKTILKIMVEAKMLKTVVRTKQGSKKPTTYYQIGED